MTLPEDHLLSAKQIAPLLGYDSTQYKAVYAALARAGVEPWRDPNNPTARRVRWFASEISAYIRRGAAPVQRHAQPESAPTRFRKKAS